MNHPKFGSKISSDDDEHDDSDMEENASAMLSDHYSKYISLSLSLSQMKEKKDV